ncbi:aldehyde dehydrogenase family protein [Flavonifractor sp. DFI.6.63]|uniref:Aldehyde dehydrogenase family protein n=1 Tax=Lawsonibacter hominis TaxID=2763053 RepID=A0A8J6M842_9FIRM|nr:MULTISPECIES: aldehyde dehydrogenase family protein [Oscillospiraceae]MBC5732125.1 aldehyde dehydrogenase family protein [Lawsonibacter hominis]MBS1383355.1 aldehyde dehydrogenase family protein [Flavonifractor sp.]MCQ5028256.1 aldehyde dehydrogenase family protein [Flavonifractor sp. DFI.6.63]
MKEYKLYINGKWIETTSGKIINDINPADGTTFARVHLAGELETEMALESAQRAFTSWSKTMAAQREQILWKAADCLEKMVDEAIEIMICESGSTYTKARSELAGAVNVIRVAAGECRRIEGEINQPTSADQVSLAVRVPLGVVAGIAPFNYPVILAVKKLAYALAAGDTFILKPASVTPLSGYIIATAFERAGLPAGVLNVIPGPGDIVGDKLVEDQRVKCVTFTGSSPVGRSIAAKAGYHLKKFAMELGGKNPLIILGDYDVEQAIKIAGYGAFYHQGQVCMASSRIIVEAPIYDAFCEGLVAYARTLRIGDPHDPDTIIGPLISNEQCDFIDGQIQDARSKGAKILTGGKHQGTFYEPTILAEVTPEMDIFYQETFGPVTSIFCVENAEQALALCNDNKFGLSSALLTYDMRLAIKLGLNMESGMVHINDTTFVSGITAPSGGIKNSGYGREGGRYSIEDYTELKWITMQYADKKMPFEPKM